MYFALTTLSTVGFGDLYPKTDKERLISTVVLLSGVSVMSYVLSELRYMVVNIKILQGDIDEKDKLDLFFGVLKSFNQGKSIDINLIN
jgi:hypothetical protein